MKRSSIVTVLSLVHLVVCGCGGTEAQPEGLVHSSALDSTFTANHPAMHVRGTMNGWGLTAMTLVADHAWVAEITTGEGEQSFKFDVRGNWLENYGDSDRDQKVDRGGANIALESGRTLLVHLDDDSGFYWIERRTWSAEVVFGLPDGVVPQQLAGEQARLLADGQDQGWVYLYADDERGVAYSPVCCLERGGRYTLRFDSMVGTQRLVGELSWTVDGAVDPIPLELGLAVASLGDYGAVELTVLADRWENGGMVSGAYANVGVYLGDWHAGHVLGTTDSQGRLTVQLPAGEQALGLMVMTSSHSMASSMVTVAAEAGQVVQAEAHIAPITAVVRAHHDAGLGRALYLTGASDYLGDWSTASRMTYDAQGGYWSFQANLPIGLPFKIVRGPWVDAPSIDVALVEFESGGNHAVPPPHGYVTSEIDLWPSF